LTRSVPLSGTPQEALAYRENVPSPQGCLDETFTPEAARLPVRKGVRLAIDVGSARIGVARCDPGGSLASPLTTVSRGKGDLARLAELVEANGAIEVIVGLPATLSGREGKAALDARAFARGLAGRVAPVPVRLLDERFTTVTAHDALRMAGRDSKARREVVDQAAAAVLLQAALDAERSTGRPAGEAVRSVTGAGK
jgi:putative holliday junction resolvase